MAPNRRFVIRAQSSHGGSVGRTTNKVDGPLAVIPRRLPIAQGRLAEDHACGREAVG